MLDPPPQRALRHKVRLVLLAGLGTLLATLVALGIFATVFLDDLDSRDTSAVRDYLNREEQLHTVQNLLSVATNSVRDCLINSETTIAGCRQQARDAWANAMEAVKRYRETSATQQKALDTLNTQLSKYWDAADGGLGVKRDSKYRAVDRYLHDVVPRRDDILVTLSEIATSERMQTMSDIAQAESVAQIAVDRMWISIIVAAMFSLAVAMVTFRYIMSLEQTAADHHDYVMKTSAELQQLSERLLTSQEDEKRKIARDLHDDYGQRMACLIFELANAVERSDAPAELRAALEAMGGRLSGLAKDLQQMSRGLHSAVLETIGLVAAVRSDCESLSRRTRLAVDFHATGIPSKLPENIGLVMYRISQEAIQNALKHSGTDRIEVSLVMEGQQMVLRVRDFGGGFEPDTPGVQSSLGLVSMRERLRTVGGTILIHSVRGQGTEVEARIPVP